MAPQSSVPSSSLLQSSQQVQPSGSQPPRQPQSFPYKADEYLVDLIPGWKPMTEAEFKEQLKLGYNIADEDLDEFAQNFNKLVEKRIKESGIRVTGLKPRPDEGNFYLVNIPNSHLAIRMWDGGMNYYNQFCLDFYDPVRRISVNLPQGFSLGAGYMPGMFGMSAPLVSWETAHGYGAADIPPGEEKWSVPEGSHITLRRVGHPEFTFAVPVRYTAQLPAIAQPTFVPAA